jgi:hypothetical protein
VCPWSRCSIDWGLSERETAGLSPPDGLTILLQRYIPRFQQRTALPKTYLNPRDTKCSQSGSISSCKSHPPAAYRAGARHGEQLFGVSRRAPRRPLSRSLTTNTTTWQAAGPCGETILHGAKSSSPLPFKYKKGAYGA